MGKGRPKLKGKKIMLGRREKKGGKGKRKEGKEGKGRKRERKGRKGKR